MARTELDLFNVALARVGDFSIRTDAAKTVTAATAANPPVCTAASHGYSSGDLVLIESFVQMTPVNGRIFEVVVLTSSTFQLKGEDGSAYTAETTGGTAKRLETGKHVSNSFLQWPIVRDELLRSHPWNSVGKYTRLSRLASAKTITAVTQATEAVVTITAHGYASADQVLIESVAGMVELNGRYFTITVLTANTFSLNGEDSTTYAAYTSGGTAKKALSPLKPDSGYAYRYGLPTDYMRAIELVGSRRLWEVVGSELYADAGITVPLRYVYRARDPNAFDPMLASLLSARLALDICERLRESNSKKESLRAEYEDLLERAKGADGQESSPMPFEEDDWNLVRLNGGTSRLQYGDWSPDW